VPETIFPPKVSGALHKVFENINGYSEKYVGKLGDIFKKFSVNQDIDTVVWPNDADFSPDFLYEIGVRINEQPHTPGDQRIVSS